MKKVAKIWGDFQNLSNYLFAFPDRVKDRESAGLPAHRVGNIQVWARLLISSSSSSSSSLSLSSPSSAIRARERERERCLWKLQALAKTWCCQFRILRGTKTGRGSSLEMAKISSSGDPPWPSEELTPPFLTCLALVWFWFFFFFFAAQPKLFDFLCKKTSFFLFGSLCGYDYRTIRGKVLV